MPPKIRHTAQGLPPPGSSRPISLTASDAASARAIRLTPSTLAAQGQDGAVPVPAAVGRGGRVLRNTIVPAPVGGSGPAGATGRGREQVTPTPTGGAVGTRRNQQQQQQQQQQLLSAARDQPPSPGITQIQSQAQTPGQTSGQNLEDILAAAQALSQVQGQQENNVNTDVNDGAAAGGGAGEGEGDFVIDPDLRQLVQDDQIPSQPQSQSQNQVQSQADRFRQSQTQTSNNQRLFMRRSLLPQPTPSPRSTPANATQSRRSQAISAIRPLTLAERADILLRNAGGCVDAVLRAVRGVEGEEADGIGGEGEEGEGRVRMSMGARWKAWEGARGSIFDNERFVHFLKLEELGGGAREYDPTVEAPGLRDALQMANIASFLRIIASPEEAAESLETTGASAAAVNTAEEALKEAGEMFVELCVPRPWDEGGGVQLLVDLVTQRFFLRLHELDESLFSDDGSNHLNPLFEEYFSPELIDNLRIWEGAGEGMGEVRDSMRGKWLDGVDLQRSRLQRCDGLENAEEQFPYDEFRREMLAYLNEKLADKFLEPDEQDEVSRRLEYGNLSETAEAEESTPARNGNGRSAADEIAFSSRGFAALMDDPALQQSLGMGNNDNNNNGNDGPTTLGDAYANALDASTRANTSAQLNDFLQSQLDEIRSTQSPGQGSQSWAVREADGSPVQIGDVLGGNKQRLPPPPALRGRLNVRQENAERIEWDSQSAHTQQQREQSANPARYPESPERNFQGFGDNDNEMQSIAGGSRFDAQSRMEDPAAQRDPRASRTDVPNSPGYYASQPDGPVVRGNAEKRGRIRRRSPEGDDEEARARKRHGPGRQGPLSGPDPYLYDEYGKPLHDEDGTPLCLDETYDKQTGNLDGWRNKPPPGIKPKEYRYRVKERVRWDPMDALFLYREVQKVPIDLPGDFVHMVLLRYQTGRLRPFNLAQCRDKMRQVVATRVNNGRAIVGNARKYLRDPDPLKEAFDRERGTALDKHRQRIRDDLAADTDGTTEGDAETQTDGESSYRTARRGRGGAARGNGKGRGRARGVATTRNASSSLAQPPIQAESEMDESQEQELHTARSESQPGGAGGQTLYPTDMLQQFTQEMLSMGGTMDVGLEDSMQVENTRAVSQEI